MHACVQHVAAVAVPVHAGVCAVVVEGVLRANAALLTLDAAALWDGEGGATALAGRDTGAVLHGVRTSDSCTQTHTQRGNKIFVGKLAARRNQAITHRSRAHVSESRP